MIWLPHTPVDKERLLTWAQERLPVRDFGPAYPVGVMRDGEIAAVVVYHQLRQHSIELSAAADTARWTSRQVLGFIVSWPFWMHDVRRLTAIVERRNKRSRKLVEGLGFAREGVCRDLFPTDDGVIYGLTKRYWLRSRWHTPMPDQARMAA